jgi:tetratricopeptide (TPR) repeat protein
LAVQAFAVTLRPGINESYLMIVQHASYLLLGCLSLFADTPPLGVGATAIAVAAGESTVDGKPIEHVFRGDIFRVLAVDGDLRLIGHPNHTSAWVDVKLLATPADARQRFIDAAISDSDTAILSVDVGRMLRNTGAVKESVQFLTKAIELKPDMARAYFERGTSYLRTGDAEAAEADLQKAAELDEELAGDALTVRAVVSEMKRDAPRAIAGYTAAIEKNPKLAIAYYQRGKLYLATREREKGISDLRKCAELNPRDMTVLPALAGAIKQANPEEAIGLLTKHMVLVPIDADALSELAILERDGGQVDAAVTDLDRLVEIAPQRPGAYYDRGITQLMRHDVDNALKDLTRFIELSPKNGKGRISRASILRDLGRYQEAIADFEFVIDKLPEAEPIHKFLARERLAWLLATVEDESVRDAPRALNLAGECRRTAQKSLQTRALATLAAAQAAGDDFDAAIKSAEEALSKTPPGSEREEVEAQLAAYRGKRLYIVKPKGEK